MRVYTDNAGGQRAQWESMGQKREMTVEAGVRQLVEDKLAWEPLSMLKKGGVITGYYGGPRIAFSEPVTYSYGEGEHRVDVGPFGGVSLFTFTTKMSCPSFSLPAGPIAIRGTRTYGTCPASLRSSVEKLPGLSKHHGPLEGDYICDSCYAGKGNYRYPNMAIKQMAVLEWTERAVAGGWFAETMAQAIRSLQQPQNAEVLALKLTTAWYFRIHDAGDFFNVEYYDAWCDVCERLPNVHFWAPTRMWVFPKFREAFARRLPPNLALRPSALTVDAIPPRGLEMDAGTMVNSPAIDPTRIKSRSAFRAVWPCPAYESKSEKSCANAPRPDDGGIGCRTCWGVGPNGRRQRKGYEVSYPHH